MRRITLAILALALFGVIKLPIETRLTKELHDAHFHSGSLNLGVRKQAGQMGFIAALSGFRSVIADGMWLWAHVAWERTAWGEMKVLFDGATTLQPRALLYWDGASNHMAYNASVAAMQNPNEPREALRVKARNEYYRLGEDYLLRGIEFNSDRALLYDRLGSLYRDKFKDPEKSYWAYTEAGKRPDSMGYVHRMAAYQLAKWPGHEREAYDVLVALYKKGKRERLPSLLTAIQKLQDQLQIPAAERIDVTEDLREATPYNKPP
jgi:hypothetical protein